MKPSAESTASLWRELADYDLKTAGAMHRAGRYLYVVFMCHQAVEKTLKGRYVDENELVPPFTHNLLVLLDKTTLADQLPNAHLDFVIELNPFNLVARYPKTKADLRALTDKRLATRILKSTRRLLKWLTENGR